MHDREEEVAEAHGKTFEWIFKQETEKGINNQFKTWLTTNELGPIYWISGKPGSGKSTLMRFLFGHSNTKASLQSWAGSLPFSQAGFFFWTSGSKEQRSQTGLLRYLLHQLLSENRTMMPKTFPDLWQKLQTLTTKERIKLSLEWKALELMEAFRSFINAAVEYSKICLFVDGLDEFDGDQQELVQFFGNLGKGVHGNRVKMCLSSRPCAVFEKSFQSSVPNLKLQQLTNQDMYHFVADTLNSDVQIRICFEGNATVKHALFKEIVQRADGVFLWARLTVTKILKDFRPRNGISQLQTMIRSQPSQLDDLFEKLIFVDQDAAEISETANLFQLITARETAANFVNDETANSLNVWEIALALDPEGDELALSEEKVQQASDDEVKSRCEDTCARIDQRFMGLLGVFPQGKDRDKRATITEAEEEENQAASARGVAGNKVTYVHRTVRDWLMEGDGVRERLTGKSPSTFDSHLRLLRAGVLVLKLPVKRPWRRRWLNDWWPQITICMTHAREIQIDPNHLLRPLLNELDRTIGWYWIPRIGDPSDHWVKHMFHSYEVRMKAPPIREPYLCLVTKFGIANYVLEELKDLVLGDNETPGEDNREADTLKEQGAAVDEGVVDRVKTGKEEEDDEEEEEEQEEDKREGTPLLSYAIDYLCCRQNSIYPLSSPSFISSLLRTPSRHNLGPNHIYTDFIPVGAQSTPWLALLGHLRRAQRRGWIAHLDIDPQGTSRWAEIVKLFLKAGADVDAIVPADRWDPEMNALDILEMLEENYCSAKVSKLKTWVATKWEERVELSLEELEVEG
jgi:AAA ATPase domain